MNCAFCKIINKEMATDIIYEDNNIVAFNDLHPQAPVHILIVPKKHIESVNHIQEQDKELIGELFLAVQKIAKENNLKGYKIAINVGREGGQIIDHLHLHLLSKK